MNSFSLCLDSIAAWYELAMTNTNYFTHGWLSKQLIRYSSAADTRDLFTFSVTEALQGYFGTSGSVVGQPSEQKYSFSYNKNLNTVTSYENPKLL